MAGNERVESSCRADEKVHHTKESLCGSDIACRVFLILSLFLGMPILAKMIHPSIQNISSPLLHYASNKVTAMIARLTKEMMMMSKVLVMTLHFMK